MTKRFNEFGATINSNLNQHSDKMQKKINEIARDMNSEFVRVSGLKHLDYVQVVSDKFEGFSEAFADIMKNESDMRNLLKRDLSESLLAPVCADQAHISEHVASEEYQIEYSEI